MAHSCSSGLIRVALPCLLLSPGNRSVPAVHADSRTTDFVGSATQPVTYKVLMLL